MTNLTPEAARRALRQAFDTPWPGPSGDAVVLENGPLRVILHPQDGGRLTSLRAFGHELLRQWNPQRRAFQYGAFPMAPWVGRLGNATLLAGDKRHALPANKPPHALHGMACLAGWDVTAQTATEATLRLPLAEPWPWRGHVLHRVSVEPDAVCLRLAIHAEDMPFPASAGWHPWFNKQAGGEALRLDFSADWQEEPGDDELPTGNRIAPRPGPWDDCFGFTQGMRALLTWPGQVCLEMTSAAHSMVVFDKQPDAACVEPLTQAPNAINRTPQWVEPGKPLTIETRWRLSAP